MNESKDDWSNNSESTKTTDSNYNLKVPSFIRLFVINRILCKYISDRKQNECSNSRSFMEQLANVFKGGSTKIAIETKLIEDLVNAFSNNVEIKTIVNNILTKLVNDGIKKYMNEWYNEQRQANIIEEIVNRIILQKFETEYNKLITFMDDYNSNDNSGLKVNCKYYQNLVFNSNDLMSIIFQYLEWGRKFNADLFCCSLVNSRWLFKC